ncbi:transglycosylase SLT domain-containing protein [Jatrophihabitans fulvus]
MTAPAQIGAIMSITARIQSIETGIRALSPAATAPGTSAAAFASTLAATSASAAASATATQPAAGGTATGDAVVAQAKTYLGVPYVWGGETREGGMDCSGLVQTTFKDLGIDLPRTAAEQQDVGTPVASLAEARPGDLVFFGDPAHHVAIYAGNNQIVESPEPGKTVRVTSLYDTPTSIRRIVGTDGAAGVAGVAGTAPVAGTGATLPAGVSPAVAAYATQFAAAERANGLPAGLLAAVCNQESGGNPNAVSPAGAQGLMQLMPSTAAGMGVNAFDPNQAIQAAGKILSRNLNEFGTVPLALAAYNAGAGAVQQYGGIPPYEETQNYVRRIMSVFGGTG